MAGGWFAASVIGARPNTELTVRTGRSRASLLVHLRSSQLPKHGRGLGGPQREARRTRRPEVTTLMRQGRRWLVPMITVGVVLAWASRRHLVGRMVENLRRYSAPTATLMTL